MKNKKITMYLLLAASLLIWGTIAWKLINAFKKEEVIVGTVLSRPTVHKPDSMVLLLSYEDPFLKEKGDINASKEEEYSSPPVEYYPQEPEVIHGPTFKFKGILKVGKKSYGLLDLDGETIMASTKEKIDGFYVVSITSDKMVVRRQGSDIELFAE